MISKKRGTILKSKKKYGGNGGPPVYNESYKETIDFYNMLETQLNDIRDRIYINNRDLQFSNNIVLEAEKESLITQMNNIKITHPEAYKYITDLILYKYYETEKMNKQLKIKNRENTNWSRSIVSNFFAEYQDRKFANGYFYLEGIELRNKFANLNPVNRPELIKNIKNLDSRALYLLQLIIQQKETRADYTELLTILDNNQVLIYLFE
jgi:hypothetical protein